MRLIIFIFLISHYTYSQLDLSVETTINYKCAGSPCGYDGPGILINELMISPTINDGSISGPGPVGGRGEWIELYNPDLCESVDISCYYLGNYTFEGAGGFRIPNGTVIPPSGFCLIRGVTAPSVPQESLVENGGNVVEIVIPPNITDNGVCSGGTRIWFPNYGGWFAFYDSNGVPQDAVSWGPGNQGDVNSSPCISEINDCSKVEILASYKDIPDNRKAYASNLDGSDHLGRTIRRIPDGGDWDGVGQPTFANCNDNCIVPEESTCDGTATVTPSGGTPPYTYEWDDSEFQTTAKAERLCAGTHTVIVTDQNGVTDTAEVTIVDFVPDVTNNVNEIVCQNDEPFILEDVSPIPLNNELGIFSGSGISENLFNPPLAGPGDHNVIYTFVDKYGCQNSAEGQVTVNPLAELSVENEDSVYCVNYESTGLVFTPPGGTLIGDYLDGNQLVPSEAGSGTHQLTYEYTNNFGCTNQLDFEVVVSDLPGVTIEGIPDLVCINHDPFTLNGNPEGGVLTINGEIANVFNPANLGIGVHTVKYFFEDNEFTCSNEISIDIEVNIIPEISFLPEKSASCPPISVKYEAQTDTEFNCEFDFGDGTIINSCDSVSYVYNVPGIYDVTFTSYTPKGCSSVVIASQLVDVYPVPIVNFTHNPQPVTIFLNEVNLQNYTEHGYEYEWFIEEGIPDYSNEHSPVTEFPNHKVGNYEVQLISTSDKGCIDSLTKVIEVESDISIYVPNTFTPDGDALNEVWKPVISGNDIYNFNLKVYNRWGELIWESNDQSVGWDGTYAGKLVKTGTYVWEIYTVDKLSEIPKIWRGHVNVLY